MRNLFERLICWAKGHKLMTQHNYCRRCGRIIK